MATSPCYLCRDRFLGCHQHCNGYGIFKEKLNNAKQKRKQESETKDFVITNINKIKRTKSKK